MTKKDKLILLDLKRKIKSGECTFFNYFEFVPALFYAYHRTSIERLFLEDLAEKIRSGVCTPDNIFLFVDAEFYQRKKQYIKCYFEFKKRKDIYDAQQKEFEEFRNSLRSGLNGK